MDAYVEITLCAIGIVVYAVDRFNRLPSDSALAAASYHSSRSTTTAASYYTAVSLYCAIALGVYAFLLLFPRLIDRMVAMSPDLAESVPAWAKESPSLLVALLLTVLLPKIPVLASVDDWFRRKLQRMAAIPNEVRRLGAELRRARFHVDEARRKDVVDTLVKEGFDPGDALFDGGSTPHALWTKLSLLMREMEAWDADPRFASYVLTYPTVYNDLKDRYEQLLPKARKCFGLLRELAVTGDRERLGAAVSAYRDDVVDQTERLLKDVYTCISQAVLLCELTHRARVHQLSGLGFEMEATPPRHLSINQLMGLFTAVSVVFIFGFVAMRGGRIDVQILVRALMIATIYCVAVWCAIYPKSRWSFARRRPGATRPWGSYLLSGALAAAVGALISLGVKLAELWDMSAAWSLYRETSPWGIITFWTAYGVAFLADDEADDRPGATLAADRLRWAEGAGLMLAMVPMGLLVHLALAETVKTQPLPPLGTAMALNAVLMFSIGCLVPSWYRDSSREAAASRERRLPAAAALSAGKA
jgi:hypothetical protein